MKKSFKYKLLLLATCAGLAVFIAPAPSKAQGIPVIDAASISQAILQLQQMQQDYQNQIDQLQQARSTTDAMTGGRGMGSVLNSSIDQDLRRNTPDTLQGLIDLHNASGLNSQTLRTQGIYNNILSTYQPLSGAQLVPSSPTGALALAHDRHANTTYAAMAASESTYNASVKRLEGYETMLQEVNNTPDLKASIDLLARITAENGIVANELAKMQSLQMQLNSAREGSELTTLQRVDTARKYDPTKALKSFEE